LFDKYLHTLAFVRSTSTVLFAALLAVSAKFARPDLYPPLLANAEQLIGRGIVEARASVGLIQAILTLIYWKPPTDMSAWLRTGIAIRFALQLDLPLARTVPLPADEHEARMILVRELSLRRRRAPASLPRPLSSLVVPPSSLHAQSITIASRTCILRSKNTPLTTWLSPAPLALSPSPSPFHARRTSSARGTSSSALTVPTCCIAATATTACIRCARIPRPLSGRAHGPAQARAELTSTSPSLLQTYMIPYYQVNMERWLEETRRFGVTDDLEQGAAFECVRLPLLLLLLVLSRLTRVSLPHRWIKVLRLSKDIANARPMQARALASHLHGMLDATYNRYLDPHCACTSPSLSHFPASDKLTLSPSLAAPHTLHTDRRSALKVTFFLAAANVALRRATLISTGTFGVTLAHFMVAACELVDAFEEVVKEGMVRYWQDNLVRPFLALLPLALLPY